MPGEFAETGGVAPAPLPGPPDPGPLERLCRAAAARAFAQVEEACLGHGLALPPDGETLAAYVESHWRDHVPMVEMVLAVMEQGDPRVEAAAVAVLDADEEGDGLRFQDLFAVMVRAWSA